MHKAATRTHFPEGHLKDPKDNNFLRIPTSKVVLLANGVVAALAPCLAPHSATCPTLTLPPQAGSRARVSRPVVLVLPAPGKISLSAPAALKVALVLKALPRRESPRDSRLRPLPARM